MMLASRYGGACGRTHFSSWKGTGYSGIENPMFYKENTKMFYGDAKKSVSGLNPAIH